MIGDYTEHVFWCQEKDVLDVYPDKAGQMQLGQLEQSGVKY